MDFPICQKCHASMLLPLSDYGQEGAAVLFKAWVCSDPKCGFELRIDKGKTKYSHVGKH